MDFHAIMEIPKGVKHARLSHLPEIDSFVKSEREKRLLDIWRVFRQVGSPYLVPPATPGGPSHAVTVISLDRFVEGAGIRSVRMIKADVEGWELQCLQGARALLSATDAPALCVEYSRSYSPRSELLLDLYDFITSINRYQVFKLRFGKETISPLVPVRSRSDLPRHDNIFCFLPHHVNGLQHRLR